MLYTHKYVYPTSQSVIYYLDLINKVPSHELSLHCPRVVGEM